VLDLVDNGDADSHFCGGDQAREVGHERFVRRRLGQHGERPQLLADLPLMEHDLVVTPVFELQALKIGRHAGNVVLACHNHEGERKDRIVWINVVHAMVPAFVGVDDEGGPFRWIGQAHGSIIRSETS
jgi:hypothetical protein